MASKDPIDELKQIESLPPEKAMKAVLAYFDDKERRDKMHAMAILSMVKAAKDHNDSEIAFATRIGEVALAASPPAHTVPPKTSANETPNKDAKQ